MIDRMQSIQSIDTMNRIDSIDTIPSTLDLLSIHKFVDENSIYSPFTYLPIDKREIVREIANFLPNIDLIGHQVLLTNKDLIPIIYNMDNIPYDLKKDIILGIIKLSQYGDSFGGILLNNYHHFVDVIL
tara:strand:+ start:343 stop:729 length:387 start_codon:yes stop_codon:yes gene_type:complete